MEERKRRKRDGGEGEGGKTTDFVFRTRVGRVGQDEERTKKCARAFGSNLEMADSISGAGVTFASFTRGHCSLKKRLIVFAVAIVDSVIYLGGFQFQSTF